MRRRTEPEAAKRGGKQSTTRQQHASEASLPNRSAFLRLCRRRICGTSFPLQCQMINRKQTANCITYLDALDRLALRGKHLMETVLSPVGERPLEISSVVDNEEHERLSPI
ncbi:hypothetical protein COOONC_17565 [Cooperia oncophora]